MIWQDGLKEHQLQERLLHAPSFRFTFTKQPTFDISKFKHAPRLSVQTPIFGLIFLLLREQTDKRIFNSILTKKPWIHF